jgi:hypothetical protein
MKPASHGKLFLLHPREKNKPGAGNPHWIFHRGRNVVKDRVATQFGNGNYRGCVSREEWVEKFEEKKRLAMAKRKVKLHESKVIREAKEIQDIARMHALDAIKALVKIMNSETASDQAVITAANVMLERGYGKAIQSNINQNYNTDAKPTEVNQAELDRRIEAALNRVEELTGGKGKEEPRQNGSSDLRKYH